MRLIWLLLLVPLVAAHGDEGHGESLYIEAHEAGGFHFTVEGYEGRNPTMIMTPGETYAVTFVNMGTESHNLAFGDQKTPLLAGGESHHMDVTVPAEGLDAYWCDPHRGLGMEGKVIPVDDENAPGLGAWAFMAVGLAFLLRRVR